MVVLDGNLIVYNAHQKLGYERLKIKLLLDIVRLIINFFRF